MAALLYRLPVHGCVINCILVEIIKSYLYPKLSIYSENRSLQSRSTCHVSNVFGPSRTVQTDNTLTDQAGLTDTER